MKISLTFLAALFVLGVLQASATTINFTGIVVTPGFPGRESFSAKLVYDDSYSPLTIHRGDLIEYGGDLRPLWNSFFYIFPIEGFVSSEVTFRGSTSRSGGPASGWVFPGSSQQYFGFDGDIRVPGTGISFAIGEFGAFGGGGLFPAPDIDGVPAAIILDDLFIRAYIAPGTYFGVVTPDAGATALLFLPSLALMFLGAGLRRPSAQSSY